MPLNMTDRWLRAEVVPAPVARLGQLLVAHYSRPADAFGSKGNELHFTGYHRSRNFHLNSQQSTYGSRDYSVRQPLDLGGDGNAVSAFDWSPGSTTQMKTQTRRLYEAAKDNDPRLSGVREIAGTLDGNTVVTFYAQGGVFKSPFDSSHLYHIHGSLWRSRLGIFDARGVFEIISGTGPAAALPAGGELVYLAHPANSGIVVLTNGVTCRWVKSDVEIQHLQALHAEGTQPLGYNAQVRGVLSWDLVGDVVGDRPADAPVPQLEEAILAGLQHIAVDLSPEQLDELAAAIAEDTGQSLTYEQVRDAAREGANLAEDS